MMKFAMKEKVNILKSLEISDPLIYFLIMLNKLIIVTKRLIVQSSFNTHISNSFEMRLVQNR